MEKFFEALKGRERMIFALLGGIIFLMVKVFFPELPFSEADSLAFFGLIGAYILGEGLTGRQIGDNFKHLLKSQKFWSLVGGIALVLIRAFAPNFQMSDQEFLGLIAMIVTFITGAGVSNAVAPKQ